jgi:DNA mismatch endonuclease (patch repair protein)
MPMSDVFPPEKRSQVMSRIQGKDTKPEIMVRQYLRTHGFGYRKNVAGLPGKPDIVLTKYRCVIFINGCFWHGHEGCKYFVIPKTRTDWWLAKINRTKERDTENYAQLSKEGWRVFIIWECEIEHAFEQTMDHLMRSFWELL